MDAIAGALLVIAPMQSHVTCFAFQSRSSSHLHPSSSCASDLQHSAEEEPQLSRRHVSATACINSDRRETRQRYLSTAPTTQLCLHHLWLNRDQRYINRKPETTMSTVALYQQRTNNPRCRVCNTCVPTSRSSPWHLRRRMTVAEE